MQVTDSSNRVFTYTADTSFWITGIVFNSDPPVLMTDELSLGVFFCWWWFVGFVFFFLPVHGRFLSRKENKCCKQLGELTAAQKKNRQASQ